MPFCKEHLGKPIASPALFGPLHDRFVQSVQTFAIEHEMPLIHFKRGQRKDTLSAQYRAHSKVDDDVVFIGIAQEKATSFKARKVVAKSGGVSFDFSRQSVAVNQIYFYCAARRLVVSGAAGKELEGRFLGPMANPDS